MTTIPNSIENYLKDAGLSATELLVLRKLMEEDALTLRQLAAKTGKSTGVLDQGIKKLLRRNIVTKEWINGTHMYRLVSLEAIVRWVEADTKQKQEMLKRRHQNFEAFISALHVDKARPEMEYFDGGDGVMQAYRQLLTQGKELLHYYPVTCAVEDDPMRDFRVQLFRERRAAGVFARYIVPDTPLGRRFATRDPFEYRKTLLVPEGRLPIPFEKVIAGNIVACFSQTEQKVCFIKYAELAATERQLFERHWANDASVAPSAVAAAPAAPPQIPLSTRALSGLREFFLSKKSLALLGVFAVFAAGVTYGLYWQTYNLNLQRLRERAMSIAATGVMRFDIKDLDALRTIDDVKKPEYKKVVGILNEIRDSNPGVAYSYLFRVLEDRRGYFEYVADADSLDPFAEVDANFDGVIDEQDQLQYPGLLYPELDPYYEEGLSGTFSTPDIHADQFGVYFTTTSPIRDAAGKTKYEYGVDIKIEQVSLLTWQSFNYIFLFLGLFLLFILIRLAAFNKSLFMEIWCAFKMKKVLLSLALAAEVAFFLTLGLYFYTRNLLYDEMGEKLMVVAASTASQFDAEDLAQLHLPRDMEKEAYQRVFATLNEIRDTNHDVPIKWAYILRPVEEEYMWEFVADADSNIGLPLWYDGNGDGIQTMDEMTIAPGTGNYQEATGLADKEYALSKPFVDETDLGNDQWGMVLSASAPILDRSGQPVAILGLDADYSEVLKLHREKFFFPLWFIGMLLALLSFRLLALRITRPAPVS